MTTTFAEIERQAREEAEEYGGDFMRILRDRVDDELIRLERKCRRIAQARKYGAIVVPSGSREFRAGDDL